MMHSREGARVTHELNSFDSLPLETSSSTGSDPSATITRFPFVNGINLHSVTLKSAVHPYSSQYFIAVMSSYPSIEFYDISCTTTKEPWSPFTARTYLALRLLGIPFKRHLVTMVQIAPLLSAAGVPQPANGERYTLPAITLSSSSGEKEWITENVKISEVLQKLYLEHGGELSKSLYPGDACTEAIEKVRQAFKDSLYNECHRWKNIHPRIYTILEPESRDFFIKTRIGDFGKPPQEILDTDAKENEERDGGIVKVYVKTLEPLANLYKKKDERGGVWLCGERANYADLMVLGLIQWMKCTNPEVFEEALKEVGGALEKAWIAGQELFQE